MKICYFCPSKYYMCRAIVFLFLLSLIDSLIWAEVSTSQIVNINNKEKWGQFFIIDKIIRNKKELSR